MKGGQGRVEIHAPQCEIDHVDHFNAVDSNNRDISEFSTTNKNICLYLRIFCWMLDRLVHTLYVILVFLVVSGIWDNDRIKYQDKKME